MHSVFSVPYIFIKSSNAPFFVDILPTWENLVFNFKEGERHL